MKTHKRRIYGDSVIIILLRLFTPLEPSVLKLIFLIYFFVYLFLFKFMAFPETTTN